jgi:hypothetical protein
MAAGNLDRRFVSFDFNNPLFDFDHIAYADKNVEDVTAFFQVFR